LKSVSARFPAGRFSFLAESVFFETLVIQDGFRGGKCATLQSFFESSVASGQSPVAGTSNVHVEY
jgi:hypothetical protein